MWILNELFWNMWGAMKQRREEGSLALLASVCSGWPVVGVAGRCYGLSMQSCCRSPTWVALNSEFYDKLCPLSWSLWRNPHSQTAVISEEFKYLSVPPSVCPKTGEEHLISVERWTPHWSFAGNWTFELAGFILCCSSICNLLPATASPWPSWGSQPQLRSSISALSS